MVTRNRFSLVELLVVMGVIALLTSLLLPALSKAKDTARQIACLSNLKQVNFALFNYTSDYNGAIPWSWHGPSHTSWSLLVYPYLKPSLSPESNPALLDSTGMYCPSATKMAYTYTTYALNGYAGGYNWDGSTLQPKNCDITRVATPSEICLLGEKEPNATGGCYAFSIQGFSFTETYDYRIAPRHNKGSNWVFFDGHAEYAKALDSFSWSLTKKGFYLGKYYR